MVRADIRATPPSARWIVGEYVLPPAGGLQWDQADGEAPAERGVDADGHPSQARRGSRAGRSAYRIYFEHCEKFERF